MSIRVTSSFLAKIAFECVKSPDTKASTDLSLASLIKSLLLNPKPETMAILRSLLLKSPSCTNLIFSDPNL